VCCPAISDGNSGAHPSRVGYCMCSHTSNGQVLRDPRSVQWHLGWGAGWRSPRMLCGCWLGWAAGCGWRWPSCWVAALPVEFADRVRWRSDRGHHPSCVVMWGVCSTAPSQVVPGCDQMAVSQTKHPRAHLGSAMRRVYAGVLVARHHAACVALVGGRQRSPAAHPGLGFRR
jgi:hypothetical protein